MNAVVIKMWHAIFPIIGVDATHAGCGKYSHLKLEKTQHMDEKADAVFMSFQF